MSTTKYQVLHRYMNEGTNTPITNKMDMKYVETMEFYTDPDHMIFSTNESDKAIAIDVQQEMISYGNSGDNPKANMIFAYDGTKKIKHKKWIKEDVGYVVDDWTRIARSKIGNQLDYTKEFTTIDKATPEDGGTVICTKAVFDKYFPTTIMVAANNNLADAGTKDNPYFTETKIQEMIIKATFFKIKTFNWTEHVSPSTMVAVYGIGGTKYYTGPVAIGGNHLVRTMIQTSVQGAATPYMAQLEATNLYTNVTIVQNQIETGLIPGHYEEVNTYPYLIKDTYKRIQLSPWFVNCTTCSLDAALSKAKILVDMIGLDNVKLIKIVPFGQFIKIQ